MERINEWLKKHWHWVIIIELIAIIIFGLFLLKKPSEKIVYKDKLIYVKQEETKKEEHESINEHLVVKTTKNTVTRPDGTVETNETSVAETKKDTEKAKIEIQKVTEYVDRQVTVIKESPKKDWRVGLLLGTSVYPFPKIEPVAPYINPIIVGAQVDRRIISLGNIDLYGGIWVQTRSFQTVEAGLALSTTF